MSTAAKVEKLIALAASSNENEARTAAFHACRLIREAGLVVLAPGDPRLAGARGPIIDMDQVMRDIRATTEEMRRQQEEYERRQRADGCSAAWHYSAPAARHPPEQEVAERKQKAHRSRKDDPERVIVDAATPCQACRRPQDKGRRMWRHKDRRGLICGLCENGVA